jgi:hypothetical protein
MYTVQIEEQSDWMDPPFLRRLAKMLTQNELIPPGQGEQVTTKLIASNRH